MEQKYYSITEISDLYRLKRRVVFDMCHARAQRFAFNPGGGKWLINRKKFEEHLERLQRKERTGKW